MSVAKFIEISSESPKSFEDAVQLGITKAEETLHNLRSAWVKEQELDPAETLHRCYARTASDRPPPPGAWAFL